MHRTFTNLRMHEEESYWAQCLFNNTHFFSAMEINYPMLISPIMLIPRALSISEMHKLYYRDSRRIQKRSGPYASLANKEKANIPVTKITFPKTSVLMAPPIILQERRPRIAKCPFDFSTNWLLEQHKVVNASHCAFPNQCEQAIETQPELTFACISDSIENSTTTTSQFFGLKPRQVNGEEVFAELLYSLTDNPFLFREDKLTPTKSFFDTGTKTARIVACMFSPERGIATVLTIQLDFSSMQPIKVRAFSEHFAMIEGNSLIIYVIVQSLSCFNIIYMILGVIFRFRRMLKSIRGKAKWQLPRLWAVTDENDEDFGDLSVQELASWLLDAISTIAITCYVILAIEQQVNSSPRMNELLTRLSTLPWGDDRMPLIEKKDIFFHAVEDLLNLIDRSKLMNGFCLLIMLLCLTRIIASMSCHPRLALLTQTISNGLDDLWHATLIILVLMACFACVGTWRFASEYEQFTTFSRSFLAEFEMLFGNFPENWQNNSEMMLFVILYFIFLFLLVQNFLLAIIVNAYTQVDIENKDFQSEEEFFTDCWHCWTAFRLRIIWGWPPRDKLAKFIDDTFPNKIFIGYRELAASCLFPNHHSIKAFMDHYSSGSCIDLHTHALC